MVEEKKGKQVVDVKGPAAEEKKPKTGPQTIEVVAGNTAFLTVKLLSDILAELKKLNKAASEV